MIKELKKTIEQLSSNPAEADTIKALKRQLENMLCIHMTDTGEARVQNYPCKGNAIICDHTIIGETASEVMTIKKCNPQNCKYHITKEADGSAGGF